MPIPEHQLLIGIVAPSLQWESLLDQIGVPWRPIADLTAISPSRYAVAIINRTITADEQSSVHAFLTSGGVVVYTTGSGTIVSDHAFTNRYVHSLPPAIARGYRYHAIFDLHSNVSLFPGQTLIEIERTGDGLISYIGVDVDRILSPAPALRKSFYCDRQRLPHERVARLSRNALRQMIHSHLEFLFHQRGLPFVHKWFYPEEQQTVFTFRVDSDMGTRSQVDEIVKLSDRYGIPTTWFLDVKSHEAWLSYFTEIGQQEVALHCYEHCVYPSRSLNRDNFGKALGLLRKHGFAPEGIAAPTGAWSIPIGEAIMDCGMRYSSEFSYDYDDLPSFPLLHGTLSPVVQLPVHPICTGTMRREQMTSREMIRYFTAVIDRQRSMREPICLYHHPGADTLSVFEEVFRYINDRSVTKLQYREYAAWWKRRHQLMLDPVTDGTSVVFNSASAAADTFVRVTTPSGQEAIVHPAAPLPVADIIDPIPAPFIETPDDLLRSRRRPFRHYLQDALDWWITTTA